jgi:hypothetical protein
MNYSNYEREIVERLGVDLIGWPLHGSIRQPGKLSYEDAVILRNALAQKDCKWVKLTYEQVLARKNSNLERVANGEVIYGPPRKQRARTKGPTDREECDSADNEQVDVEMSDL